jgi:hypothetical protein
MGDTDVAVLVGLTCNENAYVSSSAHFLISTFEYSVLRQLIAIGPKLLSQTFQNGKVVEEARRVIIAIDFECHDSVMAKILSKSTPTLKRPEWFDHLMCYGKSDLFKKVLDKKAPKKPAPRSPQKIPTKKVSIVKATVNAIGPTPHARAAPLPQLHIDPNTVHSTRMQVQQVDPPVLAHTFNPFSVHV